MTTGKLIIVRPANPNHAVFRVLRISRNGFVCKWRSSEVELWNGGKQS